MKISNIYQSIVGIFAVAVMTQGLMSCSDSWDDHYEMAGSNGTASLLQLVEEDGQLSDFLSLLKVTHVYNNNHRSAVTYADLLDADQTLTVWAPVNGTFNVDSMLTLCQTVQGDSSVSQHFVMNHIAHNLYNMNAQTDESVKMLNDKFLSLDSKGLYNASITSDRFNIPATNGLLHVVDDDAWYTYNIYEGLTSMAEFRHIGKFLSHFEKQELDEDRSIQAGIEDGQIVYSDSVMVKENVLFRVFDKIMSEDSTFAMLVPNEETWQPVYDEAEKFFNFGSVEKADSIAEYWTHVSLLRDCIFNRNVQRSEQDSIFSTSYSVREWPYHVFYQPYEAGGVMDPANIKDSLLCSNGYILRLNEWPFKPEDLFFRPITVQGEREANRLELKDCTMNDRAAVGDTISENGYLDIVPKTTTSNWTATFEVQNTLSGTYDIHAVILPKTVFQANSRDFKPNKFVATLNYVDEQGEQRSVNFDEERSNDPYRVDTVLIGRFTFPTCNYQQPETTVSLQLQCSIKKTQTKFSREMFLDCIYLKPVTEDEELGARSKVQGARSKVQGARSEELGVSEAKQRKEVRK